jgi:hypothetical protein
MSPNLGLPDIDSDLSTKGYFITGWYTKWQRWLDLAKDVIEEYREEWPLTQRQVFYRMVAVHNYPKTEKAADELGRELAKARRGGFIRMDAIRDDTLREVLPSYFDSAQAFLDSMNKTAETLNFDRQTGQPFHLEVWCEAAGAIPTLLRAVEPYSIQVSSNGGYDSVTAKNALAVRVFLRGLRGIRTRLLHFGDFDPSGEDMASVMAVDVGLMVGQRRAWFEALRRKHPSAAADDLAAQAVSNVQGIATARQMIKNGANGWEPPLETDWFEVHRVALTEDQVLVRMPPTAIPKHGDTRSFKFCERHPEAIAAYGFPTDWRKHADPRPGKRKGTTEYHNLPAITVQLEALTPTELRELLTETIEAAVDREAYGLVLTRETVAQSQLSSRIPRNLGFPQFPSAWTGRTRRKPRRRGRGWGRTGNN